MRSIIDDRGRLFGRLNVIDAALLGFVLILIPIGYTMVRLFQIPFPVIIAVAPASQGVGASRILVDGRDFRPYLRAFVSSPGMSAGDGEGILRLESPERLEVTLPALLGAGDYDLSLLDEMREVARLPKAFTIVAHERGRFITDVQAVVAPLVADVILVNDRDLRGITKGNEPAVVEGIQATHKWRGLPDTRLVVRLSIPASQDPSGVWRYIGQPVRAGEGIVFETARYRWNGQIISADLDSSLP